MSEILGNVDAEIQGMLDEFDMPSTPGGAEVVQDTYIHGTEVLGATIDVEGDEVLGMMMTDGGRGRRGGDGSAPTGGGGGQIAISTTAADAARAAASAAAASAAAAAGLPVPLRAGAVARAYQTRQQGFATGRLKTAATPVIPTAKSVGFVVRVTPKGRQFTALALAALKARNPLTIQRNAQAVAARAIKVGRQADFAANKKIATMKTRLATPAVHGLAPPRHLAPRLKMGPAALKALAAATIKTGNNLNTHVADYKNRTNEVTARVNAAARATQQRLKMTGGKIKITGDDVYEGGFDEILGLDALGITTFGGRAGAGARGGFPQPHAPWGGGYTPPYTPHSSHAAPGNFHPGGGGMPTGMHPTRDSYEGGPRGERGGFHPGRGWGDFTDLLGAPTDPDPTNPGYLIDGTPDPAYGGYGAAPDPYGATPTPGGTVDPTASGGAVYSVATPTTEPAPFGLGASPTVAPPPPPGARDPYPGAQGDTNPYSSDPNVPGVPVPPDAVVYDASAHPPQYMDLGSYSTFYGSVPGAPAPVGGAGGVMIRSAQGPNSDSGGSGYQWHDDGWWSFFKEAYAGPAGSGDTRLKHETSDTGAWMSANSLQYNWGPLIGNPLGNLRGLRYDVGGNRWFWFRDQAPPWSTQASDMQRLYDAIADYNTRLTAAQTDYTNQQMQDQLDAQDAKAQAKVQAANDLANTQTQTQIDLQQQAAQQQQDAAQAQADIQQQQLMQQQQQQEMQMYSQQAALDAQERRVQLDYFQAHPEQMFVPSQGGGDGGYDGGDGDQGPQTFADDEGYDWGDADDVPASDVEADVQ